ncbi:TPA: his operon leader peptide [Salmonella enterica]|nr:his operon leader peptide [Salmonella enterica]
MTRVQFKHYHHHHPD